MTFRKKVIVGDVRSIRRSATLQEYQESVDSCHRPRRSANARTMRRRIRTRPATIDSPQHSDSCPLPRRITSIQRFVVLLNLVPQSRLGRLIQVDSARPSRTSSGTFRIRLGTLNLVFGWCRSVGTFGLHLLRFTLEPTQRRLRICRVYAPKIERDRTRSRELFIVRVAVLYRIQVRHVSSTPRCCTNHLVLGDSTRSHLTCFTNRAIHEAVATQPFAVVVKTFACVGSDVCGQ